MSELIGQTLGQYKITAVLGEGGMATVYRAHQVSIKRDVAIKVIESKLARNPEFVKRFEREAQTVASLDHPHILKVFDFGQQGDLIYLVIELKTGGTLAQQIAGELLPLERVTTLLSQIGSALDYAHSRGIIHRDLKPQNVLLDEQNNAFLTDFGIAKLIQPDYTSLTQTGAAMGTPTYMSPEQWQGHMLDARSDLYSLGIMLYEMLTGQVPFRADTPASMMFAHLQQTPPPLRDLRPNLPRYLDSVMEKALSKSPDDRFQTAKALTEAFRDAINDKPFVMTEKLPTPPRPARLSPTPTSLPRREISRPLMIAVAVIVVFVIGGLVFNSQRNNSSPSTTPPATQVAAAASKTSAPSATIDFVLLQTQSTDAARPSITSSPTPIPTNIADHIATLNAQQTEAASFIGTLTATVWTQTPAFTSTLAPNMLERTEVVLTRKARAQTQQAQLNQTATVQAWTKTPSLTPTLAPNLLERTEVVLTRKARAQTQQAQLNQTATALAVTQTSAPEIASTNIFLTRRARITTAVAYNNQTATALAVTPTPTPVSDAITNNNQWTPKVASFGGVEMVFVPQGCFEMGSDADAAEEKPVHTVCITKQFYIDRFEVTNAQFDSHGGEAVASSHWTGPDYPRENITWLEAGIYCLKRGGRLPTEAEWEYAARGPSNLLYPWGNSSVPNNAIYNGNAQNRTGKVGEIYRPNGKSWVGAYDMSGNVWEFVTDYYAPYPFTAQKDPMNTTQSANRVMRGGGWSNDIVGIHATNRIQVRSTSHFSFIGFRCVRPIK